MNIALCNQKGGAGKTTLAVHLAHTIVLAKKRVLLVDADPQGSAGLWAAARDEADPPPFPVIGLARDTLHRDLPEIANGYDHVVIDTPPRVSSITRSAILIADLVLIPVKPSSYDVWAAAETVKLVEEAQQFKDTIKAAFLINQKITRSAIGEEIGSALEDYKLPVLESSIAQRTLFAESSAGYSVLELSAKSKASQDVKQLSKAIIKMMEIKKW